VLAAVSPDAFDFGTFTTTTLGFPRPGGPSGAVRDDPLARFDRHRAKNVGRLGWTFRLRLTPPTSSIHGKSRRATDTVRGMGSIHITLATHDPFCYDPFFFGVSSFCYGAGYGFGFPRRLRIRLRFPVYRPIRPYRPYIFSTLPGPKFVIPGGRTRYEPIQARPRTIVDANSNRDRGIESRRRDTGKPNVAPRPNSTGPSRPNRASPRRRPVGYVARLWRRRLASGATFVRWQPRRRRRWWRRAQTLVPHVSRDRHRGEREQ